MQSNDINRIFSKPLSKIVFPLEDEKFYPFYSQCSTKKKKETGKVSVNQPEKLKNNTKKANTKLKNVPETATKIIQKTNHNYDNSIKVPDQSHNELVLPERTVSRQHKWPARHDLKRPFNTANSFGDIPDIPVKTNKTCQFDLLGTLMNSSARNSINNQEKIVEDVNMALKKDIIKQKKPTQNTNMSGHLEDVRAKEVSSAGLLSEQNIRRIEIRTTPQPDDKAALSATFDEENNEISKEKGINKIGGDLMKKQKEESRSTLFRSPNVQSSKKIELLKAVDSALELSEKLSKIKSSSVANNVIKEKDELNQSMEQENNLDHEGKANASTQQKSKKETENVEVNHRGMVTRNMAKRRSGLTLKQQEIESKKRSEARKSARQKIQEEKEQKEIERKRLKAIPCQYFVKNGTCNYGDECRYSHDVEVERKKDCCRYYIAGLCLKGDACLYMHGEWPCKFFHQGYCSAGDQCKFSHEPLTDEMRSLLEARIELEENMRQKNEENPKTKEDNTRKLEENANESKESSTPTEISNPIDLLPSLYSELT